MTTLDASDARARALLRDRVRRVFLELPGALAGKEEPVHQVRVAVRRLRVALPIMSRAGGGQRVRRAVKVLRQLARAVGAGRDLDVAVGLLEDRLVELKAPTAEQRALRSRLRAARSRARRQVVDSVLDLDIDGLRGHLRRLLARGAADTASVLARAVAVREEEGAALMRGFSQIGARYLPVALHALRRHVRRLRYVAEVQDVVAGTEARAPVLWKRLQEALGVLHDHHLLACWLEEQARAAEGRGNALLARAARRERRFFAAEGRRLHAALLEMKPADLALRALQAMARGRPGRSA